MLANRRRAGILRTMGWSAGDIGWLYRLAARTAAVGRVGRLLFGEIPHGPQGIVEVGHRRYVGGRWIRAGRWQLEFMRSQGLRPHHYLLDIGCGALRGGVQFIRYLDPDHYLGMDKEPLLIKAGVEQELSRDLRELKRPRLLASPAFEFERFEIAPDFALAQSVFTHMPPASIQQCLRSLRRVVPPHGVLFATYHESPGEVRNPEHPHDHQAFRYTRRQMEELGSACGWRMTYRGVREHPRGQCIVKYAAL